MVMILTTKIMYMYTLLTLHVSLVDNNDDTE